MCRPRLGPVAIDYISTYDIVELTVQAIVFYSADCRQRQTNLQTEVEQLITLSMTRLCGYNC